EDASQDRHGVQYLVWKIGSIAAGHAAKHLPGDMQRWTAKDHPAADDHREGQDMGGGPIQQGPRAWCNLGVPQMVHRQRGAMQRAPNDESPAGAMPDATHKHGEEQVAIAPGLA